MIERVRDNIARRNLISGGEKILVAVSGGVDSMVLLHLLQSLGLPLAIAHFNHQLRAEESDEDEAFIQQAAFARSLPFFHDSANVRSFAREHGLSLEMGARQLRHAFLARAAKQFGAVKIALGHHADDQIETFWLRLLRGDVGEGLAGMRWIAHSPADSSVTLVRPLLDLSKSEIEEFARASCIQSRHDSSNNDLAIRRNQLRKEVLPLLEKFQPALRTITLRITEIFADEKSFIHDAARDASYAEAPRALQREILRTRLLDLGIAPAFHLIESLRASTEAISVGPKLAVQREPEGKLVLRESSTHEFRSDRLKIDLSGQSAASFGNLAFGWEFVQHRGLPEKSSEYFDASALGTTITLRHWQPGDRFRPIGSAGPAKLQDLFVNARIPGGTRHEAVIALTEAGEIFWVEGLRIGEVAKIRASTTRVLKWRWQHAQPRSVLESSSESPRSPVR